MRSIHADLSAAQKANNRVPYLYAQVQDRLAGVARHRRTSWYAGAEADEGHAAIVADDGSLIRTRTHSGNLYRSRVTTPTSGDTYSSWTLWTFVVKANLIALAKDTNGKLWCFIVSDSNPDQIWASTSTDDGANWSAFALQFTHSVTVTHLAATADTGGTDVLVVLNSGSGDQIAARRHTGSWQAAVVSAAGLTVTGLAIFYLGDWNVIVTGTDADSTQYVRTRIFGDGYSAAANTWSTYVSDIVTAISGASIAFTHPHIARTDTTRVLFRQVFTGTVAYDRVALTQQPPTRSFIDDVWREPVPWEFTAPYGVAICSDATNVFYTTANDVLNSPRTPATLEITADIISARLEDYPLNPKLSEIVLNNADGTYDAPGTGAIAVLTKGADILLAPGYVTTSGAKYSTGPTYHVVGFEHTYEKGLATLTLILGSPWSHLARHRFPRAVTFAAEDINIFNQLSYIAARVGYEFSSTGGSSESSNLKPPLVIQPGTSALAAFRSILERSPDYVYSANTYLFIEELDATDSAEADYKRPLAGGDQHIAEATYRDLLRDANHIQVFADDDAEIVAEEIDATEAELLYSAPRQRADPWLDTGAEATGRAQTEARRQAVYAHNDHLLAPVHCGLEAGDVIAITDARPGLTNEKRRVISLQTDYRRGPRKARYYHTLRLGAP